MTTRRALLCALPALPFVVEAFSQPAPQCTVQVVIKGARMFDNKEFVDQLIRDIKEAINDRDVIQRPKK